MEGNASSSNWSGCDGDDRLDDDPLRVWYDLYVNGAPFACGLTCCADDSWGQRCAPVWEPEKYRYLSQIFN